MLKIIITMTIIALTSSDKINGCTTRDILHMETLAMEYMDLLMVAQNDFDEDAFNVNPASYLTGNGYPELISFMDENVVDDFEWSITLSTGAVPFNFQSRDDVLYGNQNILLPPGCDNTLPPTQGGCRPLSPYVVVSNFGLGKLGIYLHTGYAQSCDGGEAVYIARAGDNIRARTPLSDFNQAALGLNQDYLPLEQVNILGFGRVRHEFRKEKGDWKLASVIIDVDPLFNVFAPPGQTLPEPPATSP